MAKKENFQEQEQNLENFQSALSSTESFIEKNHKILSIILGAIVVVIAAWLLVQNLYLEPKEQEAAEMLSKGQELFAAENYEVALNGDSVDFDGLLYLNDNYGITKSGKLAAAYIGLSYYKLGDYDSAIEYLKEYNGKDAVLKYTVAGTIGDCYVQKGDAKSAINYFLDAAKAENMLIKPVYKVKAGLAYESLGEYDKALKLYQEVKADAEASQRGIPEVDDIDKYITSATLKNGK